MPFLKSWIKCSACLVLGKNRVLWCILSSINIFRNQSKRGLDHDFDIEPQRPVINVVKVDFNAFLHLFDGIGFAAATADLRQAGNAGLDAVTGHISVDLAGVIVVMGDCMWTWSHQCHITM